MENFHQNKVFKNGNTNKHNVKTNENIDTIQEDKNEGKILKNGNNNSNENINNVNEDTIFRVLCESIEMKLVDDSHQRENTLHPFWKNGYDNKELENSNINNPIKENDNCLIQAIFRNIQSMNGSGSKKDRFVDEQEIAFPIKTNIE